MPYDNNGRYVPEGAIERKYRYADALQQPVQGGGPWGALASGIGGFGGSIVRNQADAALTNNQGMMSKALRGLPDTPPEEIPRALLGSGVPELEMTGAKAAMDDPNKDYRVRHKQWLGMGYTEKDPGYKEWFLTGKLPETNAQPTPDIKNYEYARGQGFSGTFDEYQKAQNEAKVPNTIKTEALRAQGAFTTLNKALDDYATLVDKTGVAMTPGVEKDQLTQSRRNIQLQMKELFNLGVLNGPDLALMDSMLPDPTINSPYDVTNAYQTGPRTRAAVAGMKKKLEELRNSKLNAAGMAVPQTPEAATQPAPQALPDPLGIR